MKVPGLPAQVRLPLDRASSWFGALAPRERVLVAACVIVVVAAVLFLGVWEPINVARRDHQAALEQAQALSLRIDEAARLAQDRTRGTAPASGVSLISAVDQAAQSGELGKPTRLQPQGDAEVRVWFDDVSFDASLLWIATLQSRYGIEVQSLDVEPRDAPGRVNLRASLVRGT